MRAEVLVSISALLHLQPIVRGFDESNSTEMSPNETGRRVLFGGEADPKSFPFLVLLVNGVGGFCGGSIIHDHWVMTAAHCVYKSVCESIVLHPAVSLSEKIYPIECYVHPEFTHERFRYDISLLKVRDDLIVADLRAQLIPLPGPGMHYPPGTPATVVGWGLKEDGKYPGNQLFKAAVHVQDWDECNREWKGKETTCRLTSTCQGIARRTICTKGQGPNPSGTCVGDSGGPLIIDGLVVGVVTGVLQEKSNNHCILGSSSLFLSVVDYLPWIYSHVEPGRDTRDMPVKPEP